MSVSASECAVPLGVVQVMAPVQLTDIQVMTPIEFNCTLGQAGLWTGEGPPTVVIGAAVGDEYLDLLTGTIYTLNVG